MPRLIVSPGVSRGTRTMLCRRCLGASGSVLPITMKILQFGFIAPEMNHLRPLITYSAPSRRIDVAMLAASERRGDLGRGGGRDVGLGHREGRADLAPQQRAQPLLALPVAAELVQQF